MKMEERKVTRITDQEVYDAIEAIEKDDELSLKKAIKALLAITVDTRVLVRKVFKGEKPRTKVYTDPSKAPKNGIIIGGKEK
jgi:hypothetical protein